MKTERIITAVKEADLLGGDPHSKAPSWEDLPHSLTKDRNQRRPGQRHKTHKSQARLPGARSPSSSARLAEALRAMSVRPAFAELPQHKPGSKAAGRRRNAPKKRANPLSETALLSATQCIAEKSRSPESDLLKLRLSVRAGLRVGEIADLPIEAMIEANGRIQKWIDVYASKTKSRRQVAMHPEIREALDALLDRYPDAEYAAFSIAHDGTMRRQSASCVANWFHRLYRAAGLIGCSSHSGRRTFATQVARRLGAYNGSLKDLQDLLGHASLSSTQCYLEPSERLDQLVCSLGSEVGYQEPAS